MKLEDADTLYQLFVELGAVTYLQGLLQYDIRENALGQEDLLFAHKATEQYLWDWQHKIVFGFKELFDKEDFLTPENRQR